MGLLDRLFGLDKGTADDPAEEALERLVDSVNPRLNLARNYREILQPAVQAALDFARRFVEALPPACEASAARWAGDPCLRAFFATADDVPRILGLSAELRKHFALHPDADHAYALLRMDYRERLVFGIALAGEALQSEVAQTTVDFSDHRMRVFGESEQALRANIERRAFDQLGLLALARLGEAQDNRSRLEAERSLLTARLRLLQRGGVGLAPVVAGDEPPFELDQVELELECNARELAASGSGEDRLDFEVQCVANALGMLSSHLSVQRRRMRIDHLNVLQPGEHAPGNDIEFAEVRVSGEEGSHAFAAIRVARDEPRAPPTLAEATRNLIL